MVGDAVTVTKDDRLASTLLALGDIPYEDAKEMSSAHIISLYQWDHHPHRKADGGPDEAWNLTPRFIGAHRWKTAKIDQPAMAKDRRIKAKWALHNLRMAAK